MRGALLAGLGLALAAVGALALLLMASREPQLQPRSYIVELDADQNYYADGMVRIAALSRQGGEVPVGEMTVTRRGRIEVTVPGDTAEMVFTASKGATARLRPTANAGTIVMRPLSDASSAAEVAWVFGRRRAIEVARLHVLFTPK